MTAKLRERACLCHASSQRELGLVQERSIVHRHRLRAALSNTHDLVKSHVNGRAHEPAREDLVNQTLFSYVVE